jgi:predicted flap endonuclease-1-like 5' DNA nuclease
MPKAITMIEGIGPAYKAKLEVAGISSVEALLDKGGAKKGRVDIAASTGISEKRILKWVNMADLFRINGIASQFAELLKATGVDTVKELKMRNPANLHKMLIETNEQKKLTRAVPALSQIEDFINQAKLMEPMVTH